MKEPLPGTVVAVRRGVYKHIGIVSDRYCRGLPMVISSSHYTGVVAEEPWHTFSRGKRVTVKPVKSPLSPLEVVQRARGRLGAKWSLFGWNCEHFVYWAHGKKPRSPQLGAALLVGLAVLGLLALSRRD